VRESRDAQEFCFSHGGFIYTCSAPGRHAVRGEAARGGRLMSKNNLRTTGRPKEIRLAAGGSMAGSSFARSAMEDRCNSVHKIKKCNFPQKSVITCNSHRTRILAAQLHSAVLWQLREIVRGTKSFSDILWRLGSSFWFENTKQVGHLRTKVKIVWVIFCPKAEAETRCSTEGTKVRRELLGLRRTRSKGNQPKSELKHCKRY
jgi:hypothetical protein